MSGAAREFVFCVDTEEVATAMTPPAPVTTNVRRRSTAPTVALRLPNLSAAPAAEEPPAPAATFTPWVAPEIVFSMPPKPEPAAAPAVTLPNLPPTVPLTAVAEEAQATQLEPPVAAASTASIIATAELSTADAQPLWKNPKFLLAGVAAAFLGMVSLIAMNHEPRVATEDAPAWNGAGNPLATSADASPQTPIVVRGNSHETAPQWPAEAPRYVEPTSPPAANGATPTTLFADRRADATQYPAAAQPGWGETPAAPADEDDMETGVRLGAPLPNLSSGPYEASRTGYGDAYPQR